MGHVKNLDLEGKNPSTTEDPRVKRVTPSPIDCSREQRTVCLGAALIPSNVDYYCSYRDWIQILSLEVVQ